MHYCFLTLGSWEGNAGFVRLREFGDELIKRGLRVSYVLDDRPYNREKLKLNDKAERHWVLRPKSPMQFWNRRRVLRRLRPDYVHFLDPSIKSYLALVGMWSQKLICDWDEWVAKREHYTWFWLTVEKYLDYWSRRRSFIRPVASKYLVQEFGKLGYDAVYIPYAAYLQPHADGQSPFSTSPPPFVYIGNLFPTYDHDLILEAARLLKSRGKTPAITICGSGPDLDKWRAFVAEHGLDNVSLPGYVAGELLWRHMRHARALLFPIRENVLNLARCPSKTFAYMQACRPVIACRVGEVAEALGERAIYVPADANAWADALDAVEPYPPDIDWGVERHNWSERTDRLLEAIRAKEQSSGQPLAHSSSRSAV